LDKLPKILEASKKKCMRQEISIKSFEKLISTVQSDLFPSMFLEARLDLWIASGLNMADCLCVKTPEFYTSRCIKIFQTEPVMFAINAA
jgi:hypothetical protein